MRANILKYSLLCVSLLLPLGVYAQDETPLIRPVKVHAVVAEDATLKRVYPGIIYPSQEVELSFRVNGRVIELPIRASQAIAQGDIVAKLDTRDFEADVARLEAQRDEANAQLLVLRSGARPEEIAALEAALEAANAQLDQAQDEYERTLQLVERGVAPAAQLETREAALRVASAEVDSRRQQLTIGRIGGRPEDILAAEAAIRGLETQLQSARDKLADATLRAPFDGVVARRQIENFTNVQAGQDIALIQNLATVEVAFDIPGSDILLMASAGFESIDSIVVFDALPGVELEAELVEFATQADAATQTYRGRLSVRLPDDVVVLPGMVARVVTTGTSAVESVLRVPQSALAAGPDGAAFVWRLDPSDNVVSRQPVELGDVSETGTTILTGLNAGDLVVAAGVSELQDGMAVRPIQNIGN